MFSIPKKKGYQKEKNDILYIIIRRRIKVETIRLKLF